MSFEQFVQIINLHEHDIQDRLTIEKLFAQVSKHLLPLICEAKANNDLVRPVRRYLMVCHRNDAIACWEAPVTHELFLNEPHAISYEKAVAMYLEYDPATCRWYDHDTCALYAKVGKEYSTEIRRWFCMLILEACTKWTSYEQQNRLNSYYTDYDQFLVELQRPT